MSLRVVKTLSIICVGCQKEFKHDVCKSDFYDESKHITYDFLCSKHPADTKCPCDHVKKYPSISDKIICYCERCEDLINHTCLICSLVVKFFSFDKICDKCAKCLHSTCVKCHSDFSIDATLLDRVSYEDVCLLHPKDICCECLIVSWSGKKNDSIKQYVSIDGVVEIHCDKCKYAHAHTCAYCEDIVDKFSYGTICYDCDSDAYPSDDDKICILCHRKACEEYQGDHYCDQCI